METHLTTEPQDYETETPYAPPTNSQAISHPLDGKKFIFIGNSYTYYGKCVLDKGQSVYSQSSRVNDQGLFYQICKANGIDVNVTNFTFGGHTLEDHYSGCCNADRGHDGLEHLRTVRQCR